LNRKDSKDYLTGNSVVCVVGAHRSGTSMLARLLHSCGLYLGPDSDLWPGRADNPDGFWENRCFVALNDEVLNELGGAWDLPPKAEETFNDRRLDPLRVKAQLLIEGFDSARVWGWKDPRNCLTLPFWRDLLPGLKVLVIVRNPLEVAYSLRNRNEDTSYPFGLRLWEIYNRRLIETTKTHERLVTQYDAFFKDAESELRRITGFADLPDANVKSAAALVKRGRRHIHFTIDQLIDARASAEVIELYRALIAEARQGAKALTRKRYKGKIGTVPQIAKALGPDLLPGSISRLNVSIPNSETVRREFDHIRRQAAAATQVLKVYADQGEGYSEALSLSVPLMPDAWQTLKIRGVHQLHTNRTCRLRIDPVGPAFVSLSHIAIIREEDEALLYSAECLADFAKLDLSAGLLKHEVGQDLLLLATDSDPQIYLPVIESLGEDPYRLEITLEVQSATRGAVQRQHKALREESKLSAMLEAARADIAALRQQALAESERSSAMLEATRAELVALHSRNIANLKSIESLEQQKRDVEAELAKSKNALQASYDEATRLSNVLQDQKPLQQRLDDLSKRIAVVRDALKPGKPPVRTLVDSIDTEIRRVRRRSVWWKLGTALCRLFPRTHPARGFFPDRKKMAGELKNALQGIRRTLFSKNASTEEIASALARLLELQRRARELSVSLRFANRIRFHRGGGATPSAVPRVSNVAERTAVLTWPLRSQTNNGPLLPDTRITHVFDAAWYLREYPEIAAQGINPLQHYIERGAREGRNPHPLFDTAWYLAMNPDVRSANINPFEHYIEAGGREGRDPHPIFSSKWYLEQYPNVAAAGLNPLVDYITQGAKERRSPHPMFDAHFYAKKYPEAAAECEDLLQHYLTVGWKKGFKPHPKFDSKFYLGTYPDVAEAGMEPLTHFVLQGRVEGRIARAQDLTFEPYCSSFEIPNEPAPIREPVTAEVKAIAFYLPQFHAIPENDEWWGKGFTEWTNVRRGSPNFEDHYQPHIPSVLGYYDLCDPSVLQKQAELASSYGIYGFCFYYYWFSGTVLLDLPIQQITNTTDLNFPFCICWANENWTRRWDGKDQDILMSQNHSPEDDFAFIRKTEPLLLHKNYIRVGGKPLLAVYRASLLPDPVATTTRWRNYFRKQGHGELHLAMVRSFHDQTPPGSYGFDAAIQFPPHCPVNAVTALIPNKSERFTGMVFNYTQLKEVALKQLKAPHASAKTYPGVMPSWDNTARCRGRATVWLNSCPESYYEWLSAVVAIASAKPVEERLIFINSWNEWAEGCHLEPDERFGFAWLNATSLALHQSPQPSQKNDPSRIIPPAEQCIEVRRLPDTVRLTISVLFYHREDLIERFLQSILRQILKAESRGDIECSLSLSFNYQPDAAVIAQIHQIIATTSHLRDDAVHILENGFNVGFGAGHNMVFDKFDSDIFLIMNSDVRVIGEDWLVKLVDRFRGSDAVIVGLSETASRLRQDGCGIPIKGPEEEFDFVDGSALAIRSDLARRFGLFSPSFDYFYFEDVDLCLRYRQMGLQIALLDAPYEHERSSSSRLLPQFAVENVLDRNRARLFEKWGKYLRTRTLSNRIGVRFLEIDRQLQCASLPALFGLLAEHGTAVIDLWGVHEQLAGFFQHPRIRLIPSWQTLREGDYLRYYDVGTNRSEVPYVYDIANRMGCDPDFEGAKAHLESLIGSACSENSKPSETALLYVARKSPLFDGKEPNAESFAPVAKMLRERNFKISLYTDYGTFETQTLNGFGTADWNHAALCPGIELLKEIAAAGLLVTSNNWVAELGQLLQKPTFLWLGAMSCRAAIWDLERSGCYSDQLLPCLGCYHQFGRNRHNFCLRGDIACMRPELTKDVLASLETFLDGEPLRAVAIHPNRLNLTSHRSMPSTELSLEHWPSSTANSVLVLTPVNPQLDERVLDRAKELAHRALRGMRNCRVIYDSTGEAPPREHAGLRARREATFPHRLAALAPLRQAMVDRHLRDERWVFWVDADLVDYPAQLIDELIHRAEGGIAGPLVIMEGDASSPPSGNGFGPGRFYDIAGFVEQGRWARFTPPFFDQPGPVFELDSVGCCYLVNADLYRHGARHQLDHASATFIAENRAWEEDAICQNQHGPANSFSDHYSVCQFARKSQLPVRAFADLIAYHQRV